jgi:hypothetical protein
MALPRAKLIFIVLLILMPLAGQARERSVKPINEQWKYPAEAGINEYRSCLFALMLDGENSYDGWSVGRNWKINESHPSTLEFVVVPGRERMWTRNIQILKNDKAYEVIVPNFLRESTTTHPQNIETENWGTDFKVKIQKDSQTIFISCIHSIKQQSGEDEKSIMTCDVFTKKPIAGSVIAKTKFLGSKNYSDLFDEKSPTVVAKELDSSKNEKLKKDLRFLILSTTKTIFPPEALKACLSVNDVYLVNMLNKRHK